MTTRRKSGAARKKQSAPRKRSAAGRQTPVAPRSRTARKGEREDPVVFAADCTIAQGGDVKARLARALARPTCVTLDLSAIRRVDTAGLQLLAAFIRERRAAGREVNCHDPSENLRITANLLGLGALFSPVIDDRLAAPAAGRA